MLACSPLYSDVVEPQKQTMSHLKQCFSAGVVLEKKLQGSSIQRGRNVYNFVMSLYFMVYLHNSSFLFLFSPQFPHAHRCGDNMPHTGNSIPVRKYFSQAVDVFSYELCCLFLCCF